MSDKIQVKICGLTRAEDVSGAVAAGASFVGFVAFEKSPRHVTREQARALALSVPVGVAKVVLTVDADDNLLDAITDVVPVDFLQLHGEESPERVREVKARYGLPVIKALGLAGVDDLARIETHAAAADLLLIDAKAPEGATRPGGNATPFDWSLVEGRRWSRPWFLAGGLTPENVTEALARTGARLLDVSSGVEISPGIKDTARMRAFIANVRR